MLNILLSINDDRGTLEAGLRQVLDKEEVDYSFKSVSSLVAIKNAVTSEHFDALITVYQIGAKPFTAEELSEVHESDEKMNLVVVLPDDLYGKQYLTELMNEGIYGGVFEKDSTLSFLLSIAREGRTRKAARIYYGLLDDRVSGNRVVVDPERIEKLKQYLLDGQDLEFKERLDYIQKNSSPKEMAALLASLSDNEEIIAMIKSYPEYGKYFVEGWQQADQGSQTSDGFKIGNISLSGISDVISKVGSRTEVKVRKEIIARKIIGVAGLYRGAGATTAAVSLAKTISRYEDVTLVEVPNNGMVVFNRYDLESNIGPSFVSVPHAVAEGQVDLSSVSNVYEDINFFVGNEACGSVILNSSELATILNGTSDSVVVDFGCSAQEAKDRGMLNMITHMVIVCEDVKTEEYLGKLKEETDVFRSTNIVPFVLTLSEKGFSVPLAFNLVSSTAKRAFAVDKVQPLNVGGAEERRLLEYLDVSSSKRKKTRVIKKVIQKGIVDIAVFGLEGGCGTTHTALMLADSVRQNYKVAYLELNETGQMAELASELEYNQGDVIKMFGIDIYYGLDYATFAERYRSKYNYIVLDFGTIGRLNKKRDLFSMCTRKCLCVDAAPWKLYKIDENRELLDELDAGKDIMIMLPAADKKTVKSYDIYKRVGKRQVVRVPFSKIPVECDKAVVDYLAKVVV